MGGAHNEGVQDGGAQDATTLYDELYLLFDEYIVRNCKQPNTYESLFCKKEFVQFAKLHGTSVVVTSPKKEIKNKDEIIDELIYAFKLFAKYTSMCDFFSKNEEVDDINTIYLKFLLIPYILGVLCYETISMEIRSDRLKEAKLYFGEFINVVNVYKIAPVEDYLLDEGGEVNQAMNRRNIKVKRAKDEKKLQDFYDDMIKMNVKKGSSQNYNHLCFADHMEEEQIREIYLSLIKCKCLQTLNMMDLIDTEIEVLEMRNRQQVQDKQHQNGKPTQGTKDTHDGQPPHQNKHPKDGIKKPWLFTIKKNMPLADMTQMRNYYRDLVFTPAHNLPTISLEECAKIEMEYALKGEGMAPRSEEERRGNPKSGTIKGAAQNGTDDEEDYEKSSKEESEKELMDREWDDWKDMHQKGIGNKNRNVA
ncbi:type 2A phosphatase-associated protein 42, putative [Plasmodium knowlesi strain H]|uniref:Type 2A phosphatase-associated protein 42, putative n=3 Tax=Plasmodium knowlesi TaxID=5850 RepID=A0A5K1UTG7_PLAKH|nr:uncharacterized protein PKNH_0319600 [Plasmodium knowlesi strain H]OTN68531.1 putative Type 2A phosphatase-associated protein 42 [Plasmodium knowlesi]CAA9986621.1 type 2A phosphatase-associated protein 42, putative [Plasmodium knowlesi strain H]SBO24100.1 type 2A phosphatase-associated protein 42, putative [Plasmodium knowlesi strain H]SBO29332.1 type 2A phosphatase-associated protein 42, putative [Plasmodium knowlesi strain H]VVS76095.1 type 2A phosphatase-associated protein 42, putative [|eukprot:XP_002261161.1 [Plasmodium knowlesi strain H]